VQLKEFHVLKAVNEHICGDPADGKGIEERVLILQRSQSRLRAKTEAEFAV
jgi:hypothetical protein